MPYSLTFYATPGASLHASRAQALAETARFMALDEHDLTLERDAADASRYYVRLENHDAPEQSVRIAEITLANAIAYR